MNNRTAHPYALAYLAMLVLGVFYLTTSYAWYNLNHYKLLVAWSGCALLLVMSFAGTVLRMRTGMRSSFGRGPLLLLLLCLLPVLTTLPGLMLTEGRHAYFFGQEVALWLICCSWMLLLMRLLSEPEKLAEFLLALALIVIAVAILALWRSLGDLDTQTAPQERESGTFGNPNYLACFLVMHIPLFGLCALSSWQSVPAWQGRSYGRVIFLAAALLSLVALFLTQSRVAMATLAVILAGLLVMALCARGALPSQLRKTAGLLLLLLVIAGAALPMIFPEITEALTSRLRSTPESRLVAWRAAWTSIGDAPWFGWGAGSSYSLFFQYVDPASRLQWNERSYAHPHNELLEILQEGGVLGMLGYLAFICLVLVTVARLLASTALHRDFRIVVLGILCALLAYHFAGLASVDTRMAVVRLSLFTLLALLFAMRRFAHGNDVQPPERSGILNYASIFALLAASALPLVPDLASRYRYVQIMQESGMAAREQLLEDLRDSNPNVYALEQLVQIEIANRDFAGATRTLQTLDSLVPNYSISGYFKAASLWQQNKRGEAKVAALDYQRRDLYLPQTAYLLAKLAITENDPSLLQQQLALLITPLLITEVGLEDIDSRSVVPDSSRLPSSCSLASVPLETSPRLKLSINSDGLDALMQEARAALSASDPGAASRYQTMIASGLRSVECEGFDQAQNEAFRALLQRVLMQLASREF